MKEITVQELKKMLDAGEQYQLIDVREPHEAEIAEIGGILIPMSTVAGEMERIAKDIPVIIHCRSGARSASVVNLLERQYGFTNVYNLKGGIIAWAKEIDPSLTIY